MAEVPALEALSRYLHSRRGMAYTLYYTAPDRIRTEVFSSLREAQASYSALPRRLRPAWVCDDDGKVILGAKPDTCD